MNTTHSEKRTQPRTRRADAIAWRLSPTDFAKSALLLERSEDGLAFAWRGQVAPAPDTLIELSLEGSPEFERPLIARVRRVAHVHDNLLVIGAELWRASPFPPEVEAEVKPRVTRPTPRRAIESYVPMVISHIANASLLVTPGRRMLSGG